MLTGGASACRVTTEGAAEQAHTSSTAVAAIMRGVKPPHRRQRSAVVVERDRARRPVRRSSGSAPPDPAAGTACTIASSASADIRAIDPQRRGRLLRCAPAAASSAVVLARDAPAARACRDDHPERVDVGALIDRLAPCLFRRHVLDRADDAAGRGWFEALASADVVRTRAAGHVGAEVITRARRRDRAEAVASCRREVDRRDGGDGRPEAVAAGLAVARRGGCARCRSP